MFALLGFASMGWNVTTVSLRQAAIPARLFGRVGAVYRLLGYGGMSFGALLGGLLARQFGLAAPFWAAACIVAATALFAVPFLNNGTVADTRGDPPS